MVEGQVKVPVPGVDDDRGPGVVSCPRRAFGPGDENGRDRVQARIASGVGVGAELIDELDVERGFFAGLADGGRFERFAVVDEAAGEGPAGRGIFPLDEHDPPSLPAVHHLDDDVDRWHGVPELLTAHRRSRAGGPIVGADLRPCQFLGPHAGEDKGGCPERGRSRKETVPRARCLRFGTLRRGGRGPYQGGKLAQKMLI